MDTEVAIKERRSVRKYKDEKISHELVKEIIEVARFAPSWANFQVVRYTIIDNPEKIKEIGAIGVNGFAYNIDTLRNAKNVLILSFVQSQSGKLDPDKAEYATSMKSVWEVFDAGLACQTFCLAAHTKGIATCIMGIIDVKNLATIAKLPQNESVAALIVYGYEDGETPLTPRKSVDEITRFVK